MMGSKKYQICLGHIASLKNDCKGCISDDFNKMCDRYKPVTIYTYFVKEADGHEKVVER